jgi:hypothetical protein
VPKEEEEEDGTLLFIVGVFVCFIVAAYSSPLLLVWKISDNTFALHPD